MTWIDVFDSAVKIGLGALITATSTYLILRKTHRHEFDKEVHMHQLKYFEEKKIKYIEFLSHSQMLVQKYRDRSCNAQEDDYISYLKIYNEIQVIS
ncbi:hypothetical protein Bresa_03278|uniref:Uncharacterized protein n=1 Tax=Brenneria salicis ATCC 15712 = DSM 30166 TaxID=714314 RepID=A0A366I2H3_9GAMM|nr:hypothetical protein [Brenneria salicis]NMN92921.1 hypothetical protein [Brenneria salicis ATCC 15712 = DSM 30166]RBP60959.1 hypothetical protein DES54_12811 [Brenneria salicis ATCC 15712 = DSM 30166]